MAARVGIEQLCDNKNSHISNLHAIPRHNYLLMHTVQKIPELNCLQVVSPSLSPSSPFALQYSSWLCKHSRIFRHDSAAEKWLVKT